MSPLRIFLGTLASFAALSTFYATPARAERFLSYPSDGVRAITCDFCCYINRYGRCHHAIDYGIPTDGEIRAAAAGIVTLTDSGRIPGVDVDKYEYGNQVRIRHPNGYLTIYAHLLPNTITVEVGDPVEAGKILGKSDNTGKSTGPHLHFEVRDPQGRRVNPYGDPPDYAGGCGPNALWATCPPTPAPPRDSDGDGYTTTQGDCDDRNRDVHPGAAETCNGRDDDCSGSTDDPWHAGLAQDIGNPCTVGIGACVNTGQWICAPDGRATICSATPGTPSAESCNNRDDDCDGQTDDEWNTAIGQPCTIEWDACRGSTNGQWECAPDGRAVVCGAPEPGGRHATPEIRCNHIDDDCNGETDNLDTTTDAPYYAYHWFISSARQPGTDRFGLVTSDCTWLNCYIPAEVKFSLRDAQGTVIVPEIELYEGGSVYGVKVVWADGAYIAAIVASEIEGPTSWMRRLSLYRVSADGVLLAGPITVADIMVDVNVKAHSQVFMVPGPSTLHFVWWEDVLSGDPAWYDVPFSGDSYTKRETIRPITPPPDSMAHVTPKRFHVAYDSGYRVAAWIEQRSNGDQWPELSTWDASGQHRSVPLHTAVTGGWLEVALSCTGSNTCAALSLFSASGRARVSTHTVELTALEVTTENPDALRSLSSGTCIGVQCDDVRSCAVTTLAWDGFNMIRNAHIGILSPVTGAYRETPNWVSGYGCAATVTTGATASVLYWSKYVPPPNAHYYTTRTTFCP